MKELEALTRGFALGVANNALELQEAIKKITTNAPAKIMSGDDEIASHPDCLVCQELPWSGGVYEEFEKIKPEHTDLCVFVWEAPKGQCWDIVYRVGRYIGDDVVLSEDARYLSPTHWCYLNSLKNIKRHPQAHICKLSYF